MKSLPVVLGILLVMFCVSACGPSPEQVATMTASAWTPTALPTATPAPPTATPLPTPTLTATPVPYDLTVTIADEQGAPVAGASIILPESGNGSPVQVDEAGKYAWKDLPGPDITLKVSAPGYIAGEQKSTLERGAGEIKVVLKSDPFGLTASAACAQGEKWLYSEDFQNKKAPGWNEIELKMPGWEIIPAPDEAGNLILSAKYDEILGDQPLNSRLMNGMTFDNAVWRTRFMISKVFSQKNWFSFNWRQNVEQYDLNGTQIFDSRYQIPVGFNYFAMRRLQQPVTNVGIGQVGAPKAGVWHWVELATFNYVTEVWLDGKRLMAYEDPQPMPAGTIALELWLQGSQTVVYFDNISVCELSEPFATLFPPANK